MKMPLLEIATAVKGEHVHCVQDLDCASPRKRVESFQPETFASPRLHTPFLYVTAPAAEPAASACNTASVATGRSAHANAFHGGVFGLINFVICVPTLISYAAIVFRRPEFFGDMPGLTKLFFLSSAVHQLFFSIFSSLPFAVGQVQDVGLIFLSEIATAIFVRATAAGFAYAEALATVLVACAGATSITGVVVWLVGKLKLSGYVQLLPLPVVGGYLGYIGYFCLAAGASLGTGLTIDGFSTWLQFWVWDPVLLVKLSLSMAFALFLFFISYNVDHVAALPTVLVATPLLFFAILFVAGIPLDDARAGGWIPYPDPNPAAGWECFELFNGFEGIAWSLLPSQIPTVVGLFCVVTFGSVLDIAAIQTEQPDPLDFDGELRMIGISNLASGFSGGFTGSYIFSQVIFSQRQGVKSILNGLVIAVGEFILFLAPVDVLKFFPGFYIGGIMAFFGIDIMLDWLVHSRGKVSSPEYALLILTFFFVMFLGVIGGCAAGVGASALTFILVYSITDVVGIRVSCPSTAVRSGDERDALRELQKEIACLEFHGYLFFGASIQLSDRLIRDIRALSASWVVLDFSRVAGLDSTSARALSKLVSTLRSDFVKIAFSGTECKAHVHRLLLENGCMPSEKHLEQSLATIEDNIDAALAWCERDALRKAGILPPAALSPGRLNSRKLVENQLHEFLNFSGMHGLYEDSVLRALSDRLELQDFAPERTLFNLGDTCDFFMLLYAGSALSEAPEAARSSLYHGRFTFEPGSLLGEQDFFLRQPCSYTARAGPTGCQVALFRRSFVQSLEKSEPQLAMLVQRIALRSVCWTADALLRLHVPAL